METRLTPTVSIIVGGDLCPAGRPEKLFMQGKARDMFAELVPLLNNADLAIANLECPLTEQGSPIEKTGPHLHAHPACAIGIHDVGFDVVSLANNHIRDMGQQGVLDTFNACEQAGLKTVGAGRDLAEASKPLLIELKTLRLAVLAMTEHEFSIATDILAGASPLDLLGNLQQIQAAKANSDFTLVLLHGGNEHYHLPSPQLARTCRFLVDIGANAIICSHTHVPSGMETYHETPIIYSTGNLLFDQIGKVSESWFTGYLVNLTIQPKAVLKVKLIPYRQCKAATKVELMAGDERQQFIDEIGRLSHVISNDASLLAHWQQFCSEKRVQYLSTILCLSRLERKLLKIGIWPFWRISPTNLSNLLNTFRCESHHELGTDILTRELLN